LPPLTRHEFDQQYIERLIAEDPETEQHFTRYFGDLLTLKLRARLRSRTLVEDVRQETFARVLTTLKKKGGLSNPGTLGAFVNGVCNNVLFEAYRADARAIALEDGHDEEDGGLSAESSIIASEEQARVRRAIEGLPAKDKELLRALFFEGRDKDEICRELNVDRNYLRVLLHRAKTRFRDEFLRERSA
jgi:RNA polymerase sigma-70 factor (ECF subfamily)